MSMHAYFQRPQGRVLSARVTEPRRLIQFVGGPRQAGKTTLVRHYWRDRNREVDFVLRSGRSVVAIEVKSGRAPAALPGLSAFSEAFRPQRTVIVSGDGIALEEFLSRPAERWLEV